MQSTHAVSPGRMTLAFPLNPSVPPSTMGMTEVWSRSPSSSWRSREMSMPLIQRRARTESSPHTTTLKRR